VTCLMGMPNGHKRVCRDPQAAVRRRHPRKHVRAVSGYLRADLGVRLKRCRPDRAQSGAAAVSAVAHQDTGVKGHGAPGGDVQRGVQPARHVRHIGDRRAHAHDLRAGMPTSSCCFARQSAGTLENRSMSADSALTWQSRGRRCLCTWALRSKRPLPMRLYCKP